MVQKETENGKRRIFNRSSFTGRERERGRENGIGTNK
jgi:hypothetical protein